MAYYGSLLILLEITKAFKNIAVLDRNRKVNLRKKKE